MPSSLSSYIGKVVRRYASRERVTVGDTPVKLFDEDKRRVGAVVGRHVTNAVTIDFDSSVASGAGLLDTSSDDARLLRENPYGYQLTDPLYGVAPSGQSETLTVIEYFVEREALE